MNRCLYNNKFEKFLNTEDNFVFGQLCDNYGTCNIEIILLQKYGFLREEALLLLKPNYSDYIRIDNQTIKIRRNIVDVVTDDLHSSLKTIMINYPEIFID